MGTVIRIIQPAMMIRWVAPVARMALTTACVPATSQRRVRAIPAALPLSSAGQMHNRSARQPAAGRDAAEEQRQVTRRRLSYVASSQVPAHDPKSAHPVSAATSHRRSAQPSSTAMMMARSRRPLVVDVRRVQERLRRPESEPVAGPDPDKLRAFQVRDADGQFRRSPPRCSVADGAVPALEVLGRHRLTLAAVTVCASRYIASGFFSK